MVVAAIVLTPSCVTDPSVELERWNYYRANSIELSYLDDGTTTAGLGMEWRGPRDPARHICSVEFIDWDGGRGNLVGRRTFFISESGSREVTGPKGERADEADVDCHAEPSPSPSDA